MDARLVFRKRRRGVLDGYVGGVLVGSLVRAGALQPASLPDKRPQNPQSGSTASTSAGTGRREAVQPASPPDKRPQNPQSAPFSTASAAWTARPLGEAPSELLDLASAKLRLATSDRARALLEAFWPVPGPEGPPTAENAATSLPLRQGPLPARPSSWPSEEASTPGGLW